MADEIKIRDFREEDAPALARMWQESLPAWPPFFNDGIPYTAERVLREQREFGRIFTLVAAERDEVPGFCGASFIPKEKSAAYVAILNVSPSRHKQGLGKRLLLETLRRVSEMGYERLDLHTWTSNLPAVPLYKKTGFFWEPETTVHMINYLPKIFRNPLARAYFDRHDWYQTLKRELKLMPDEQVLGKLKVFVYEWEEGRDRLKVTVNHDAREICAIENQDLSLTLTLPEPEPVVSLPHTVTFKAGNRTASPLKIVLSLSADGNEEFHNEASLSVVKEETVEATLRIKSDITPPKDDMPSWAVRAMAVVNDVPVRLACGFRPKQPVETTWLPKHVSVGKGLTTKVALGLQSRLDSEATTSLVILPPSGVELLSTPQDITVPAKGRAGCVLELRGREPGFHTLRIIPKVKCGDETISAKPKDLPVAVLVPETTLARSDEEEVVLENSVLRVVGDLRGANLVVRHKPRDLDLAYVGFANLTPPLWPNEFQDKTFMVCSLRDHPLPKAVLSAESGLRPGVTFEQEVTLLAGEILEVVQRVNNATTHLLELNALMAQVAHQEPYDLALPLKAGFVLEPHLDGEFPIRQNDLPDRGEDYLEPWWAQEGKGWTTGGIWPGANRLEYPMVYHTLRIPAQGSAQTEPLLVYVGEGTWESVRKHYHQAFTGNDPARLPVLEPGPVVRLELEPQPLIVSGKDLKAELTIRNLRRRAVSGTLRIAVPEGYTVTPEEIKVGETDIEKPFTQDLSFTSPSSPPEISRGSLVFETPSGIRERDFSIIALKSGPILSVREEELKGHKVWRIDNGRFQFLMAPGYSGTLFAWMEEEVNHLHTAFPEPGMFSWRNPFYGGLEPLLSLKGDMNRMPLHKEEWSAEPVERKGKSGHLWKGVRLSASPKHKDYQGLALEMDHLTLPGASLLATFMRLRNHASGGIHAYLALEGYPDVDRSRKEAVLHYNPKGGVRPRGETGAWHFCQDWTASQSPGTGRALVLVTTSPKVEHVAADVGSHGTFMGCYAPVDLWPSESREYLMFWALAQDLERARLYEALSSCKDLP
jgi:ribosomal protein S18 acetylase RimI-like enzyme